MDGPWTRRWVRRQRRHGGGGHVHGIGRALLICVWSTRPPANDTELLWAKFVGGGVGAGVHGRLRERERLSERERGGECEGFRGLAPFLPSVSRAPPERSGECDGSLGRFGELGRDQLCCATLHEERGKGAEQGW
jgi:hypothetical protein